MSRHLGMKEESWVWTSGLREVGWELAFQCLSLLRGGPTCKLPCLSPSGGLHSLFLYHGVDDLQQVQSYL